MEIYLLLFSYRSRRGSKIPIELKLLGGFISEEEAMMAVKEFRKSKKCQEKLESSIEQFRVLKIVLGDYTEFGKELLED